MPDFIRHGDEFSDEVEDADRAGAISVTVSPDGIFEDETEQVGGECGEEFEGEGLGGAGLVGGTSCWNWDAWKLINRCLVLDFRFPFCPFLFPFAFVC